MSVIVLGERLILPRLLGSLHPGPLFHFDIAGLALLTQTALPDEHLGKIANGAPHVVSRSHPGREKFCKQGLAVRVVGSRWDRD